MEQLITIVRSLDTTLLWIGFNLTLLNLIIAFKSFK